ncbi:MAG: VWA domain-containing protein [Rhodopirellula sp.]|nr:VWA domain-containing protein [Rhodopirellula sp.]
MTALRFQDPLWLLLLVPLAIIAVAAIGRQRRTGIVYSETALPARLPRTTAQRIKRALPWVRVLGMAMVVLALARPQRGKEELHIESEGVAIEMCIDRSGSMQALDFELDNERVNRLEAVKRVFRDFVAGNDRLPGRPDDLIGLVDFGGFADAKCPLTLDHGAVLEILESVEIPSPVFDSRGQILNENLLGEDMATAIGDALVLAVDRLKGVKAKSKVIILLSDGKQTAGVVEPGAAAEAAKAFGIKIYTIGVGSTGTAPFPTIDFFGNQTIAPQPVELDEATLKALAEATGGQYFNARNTGALEEVYANIDRLEKTPSQGRIFTQYRELYYYVMWPGIGLILLELAASSTRFRSLP